MEDEKTDSAPELGRTLDSLREQATPRRAFLVSTAAAGLGAVGLSGLAAADEHEGNGNGNGPNGNGNGMNKTSGDQDVPGTDVDVLNYALTLEHLEDQFYKQSLESLGGFFSRETIENSDVLSGFGDEVRTTAYDHLTHVGEHEATHVDVLETVITTLGGEPVSPAEYDFGTMVQDDPTKFFATAQALENTGVMAYTGALDLIESPDLQTAGATVATVEARHASYLNLLNGDDPFPAAFDEAKSMDEILEIAGQFIVE
ncbi:ferritin-like domain-containing protein (plasmid) [Haloferax larsenii]|uniref:Ferritin-like domain-containing protein n=1 Tax=Haloferax larsenii TaxID=302484 RepID=A0ABY5RJF9_HALLR|nr:ferritin-like domain-containing protein [Haloferax larsenii]UVE52499.1 ferritin-like domain-containing protein [Haloferax larsenii]